MESWFVDANGNWGGFKEVIFEVSGEEVYGTKYESGTSGSAVPRRNSGRVPTSAATVIVLRAEEFDVEINMNDVRVDYFCSSGPGESVNTTYSAVRLTHGQQRCPMSSSEIPTQKQRKSSKGIALDFMNWNSKK